jgi:hypothetical protein
MTRRLATAIVVALAVAACSPTASGPPAQSGLPRASSTPIVAPIVLPIDPGFEAVEGASRGAFALRLEGDFGTDEFHGGGNCFWDETSGQPVLEGFGVTELAAFGEQLEIIAFDSLIIHRTIGGRQYASYRAVAGTDIRDVSPGGDLRILAFRDIAQDPDEVPEAEAPFPDFHRPFGGLPGAERVSGVLAWQCELPAPQPTPYSLPTARCPGPAQQPEPPVVSASVGDGPAVPATRGSYTTVTCSTTGVADAIPEPPDVPVLAHPAEMITFTVPDGWRFLRWGGFDTPLVGEGTNIWEPVDLPDKPRSFELPVPARPGDSIVGLTVVIVSDDETAVLELAIEVLVRVS